MSSYTYPDKGDHVTIQYIQKNEPYQGYWGESEKRIFEMIEKNIEHARSRHSEMTLLDAGCGEGRLLSQFHGFFSSITAVDPDKDRLRKAQEVAVLNKFIEKVNFLNVSIEDIDESQKYDVILCSHVIQHVHTDLLINMLEKFRKVLKKDGLLFILTCHSIKEKDCYTKSFMELSMPKEIEIDQDEFNSLVYSQGILPAHFFTEESISSLLLRTGFKPFEYRVFHCMENAPAFAGKLIDRDILINASDDHRKRNGRDLYIASTGI